MKGFVWKGGPASLCPFGESRREGRSVDSLGSVGRTRGLGPAAFFHPGTAERAEPASQRGGLQAEGCALELISERSGGGAQP